MNQQTTPPPDPTQPANSFYHKAADFSAKAPAIAIGAIILSTVTNGILIVGLICGIIALFGIPRHGKRGLLGKAIVGILVPVLLVLSVVFYTHFVVKSIEQKKQNFGRSLLP
jgi:hypothetical protein